MAIEFILRGVGNNGEVRFYTGRAGEGWLDVSRTASFVYSEPAARRKASIFNANVSLHGFWFTVQPADGRD